MSNTDLTQPPLVGTLPRVKLRQRPTIKRLVSCFSVILMLGLVAGAAPSLARAESVEVSYSGEPTQDVPAHISVTGVADGDHFLYVYVNENGDACPVYPYYNTGTTLAGGTAISAGSFSEEYTYTPTSIETYTLCAYLDEDGYGTPDATATGSFTAAMPSASVAAQIVGTPTQDVPLTLKVAGTTEVARSLYVYVDEGGDACPVYPYYNTGTTLASGTAVSAGSFSKEYSYTPTNVTPYMICVYVDESGYGTPDATGSAGFTTAMPDASISVAVSPAATENGTVGIKVSGSTEVARDLYVVADEEGGACPTYPDYNTGTTLASGTAISSGSFRAPNKSVGVV